MLLYLRDEDQRCLARCVLDLQPAILDPVGSGITQSTEIDAFLLINLLRTSHCGAVDAMFFQDTVFHQNFATVIVAASVPSDTIVFYVQGDDGTVKETAAVQGQECPLGVG